jgi:uncharacterized membrane protein
VAAFAVRFFVARQLVFPPLDDPAFYIQTARNLAAGRGLVIDVVWTQFVPFAAVTHLSHEFWMPLTTALMAVFIRLFGDTLLAAQLPDVLAGALLPVLTYALGRTIWKDRRRWSLLAAILVIPAATLVYQSASSDSSALYAVLAISALSVSAAAIDQRSIKSSFIAGILCGLSYLTRSHGSLLPIAIGLYGVSVLRRERPIMLKLLLAGAVGYFIFAVPWWLRNLNAFGAIQPIPFGTLVAARDYGDLFNYTQLPMLSDMVSYDLGANLLLRLKAIGQTLVVIVVISFPFGIMGLPFIVFRRHSIFRLFVLYSIFLFLGFSFLFPTSATTGSFYHSAGAFAPLGAIGCVLLIQKLNDRFRGRARSFGRLLGPAIYIACAILIVIQACAAWPAAIKLSQIDRDKFQAAADWLRQNVPAQQTLIATQAHSLNYVSGYPAVTLPANQDVSIVRQMAERYAVRYVVITEPVGLYPDALNQAGVKLAADVSGALIYDLKP